MINKDRNYLYKNKSKVFNYINNYFKKEFDYFNLYLSKCLIASTNRDINYLDLYVNNIIHIDKNNNSINNMNDNNTNISDSSRFINLLDENISQSFKTTFSINLNKGYRYNKNKIEKYFSSFNKKYISGIWIIKDSSLIESHIKRGESVTIYEVAETSSIKDEMIKDLQFIYLGKRDSRKNIYKSVKRNTYSRFKYQQIYLDSKKKIKRNHDHIINFSILSINNDIIPESNYSFDKNSRLIFELIFSLITEPKYWSPNPFQRKILNQCVFIKKN